MPYNAFYPRAVVRSSILRSISPHPSRAESGPRVTGSGRCTIAGLAWSLDSRTCLTQGQSAHGASENRGDELGWGRERFASYDRFGARNIRLLLDGYSKRECAIAHSPKRKTSLRLNDWSGPAEQSTASAAKPPARISQSTALVPPHASVYRQLDLHIDGSGSRGRP